jgi:import inner membrane translocase subunit TIM17
VFWLSEVGLINYPLIVIAGPRVAFRNAIFGGIILGMIQLVEVIMIRWQKQAELKMYNAQVQDEIERQRARRNIEMERYKTGS